MKRALNIVLLTCALVFLIFLVACLFSSEARHILKSFVSQIQDPYIFFPLMAVLPVLGCPLSVFLVPLGLQYNLGTGLLVLAALTPIHLVLTWVLANSFLRRPIEDLLKRKGYSIPEIPKDKIIPATFLGMAVPGPPFFLKNYLMVLAGIPFGPYFFIGWFVHFLLNAYWIVISGAVHGLNRGFLVLVFLFLAVGYLVIRLVQKRARGMMNR